MSNRDALAHRMVVMTQQLVFLNDSVPLTEM